MTTNSYSQASPEVVDRPTLLSRLLSGQRVMIWLSLGLFMLSIGVYYNAVDGELLYSWDDNRYVRINPLIRDLSPSGVREIFSNVYFAAYIPVTILSYAIEYSFWGTDPEGYHATNIVLHAFNGVLVLWFVNRLQESRMVAIITALLFILHPLQVENVAWISQRKSLLCMFFFLLSFLAHTRSQKTAQIGWLMVAWLLFLISVLSKPTVVLAPILFVLYDIFWSKIDVGSSALRTIPYWIIGVIGIFVIGGAHSGADAIKDPLGETFIDNLGIMSLVFWDYIESILYPFDLNNFYIYQGDEIVLGNLEIWLGVGVLLGIAALAIWQPLGKPHSLFAATWIVVMMLPVSNIIPIAIQRADRYVYFPSIVIFMLVGLGFERLWYRISRIEGRYILSAIMGGILVACLITTTQRSDQWHNSDTLWGSHLEDYPTSETGLLNHGVFFYNTDQLDTADTLFTELLRYYPNHFKANRFRGKIALFDRNDYVAASEFYTRALNRQNTPENREEFGGDLLRMGRTIQRNGNTEEAIAYYVEASKFIADNPLLYIYAGEAHTLLDNAEAAQQNFARALELDPDSAEVQAALGASLVDIGVAYFDRGEFDSALATYEEALIYLPQEPIVYNNLGFTYFTIGDYEQAISEYEQAVNLNPSYVRAWANLGEAARAIGNNEQAVQAYQRVIALEPENASAIQALAELENGN